MAIQVGDKLPRFEAYDDEGNVFDSSTVVGIKPVVFYFYPKDNTSGCTAQACSFRDQYQDFTDLGAVVIGISNDSTSSHKKFAKKHRLPFRLLSDPYKKIRNLFGVKTNLFGLIPGRVTYVLDENGIVKLIFDSMMATNHIPKSLEIIKNIVKSK
jgi:thioredoxin-dependent peroxiredoxin